MAESIRQFFIRPHRQTYYPFDLGPAAFLINGQRGVREDFQIDNVNEHKLMVSYYRLDNCLSQNCVVYLHTHNGSKLQALPLVENVLSLGVNLCIFDFAGYGNSEGTFVSLGSKEIWDIECVIEHLKEHYRQKKFILWGRSMGAVAALLYLAVKSLGVGDGVGEGKGMSRENAVIGGVYDSPFHSLQKLTIQIGSKNLKIPEFLVVPFVFFIKNSLRKEIDFEELQLGQKMRHIKVPGLFVTSQNDNFVHYSHSEVLYKEYGGRKELIYIEKDHNQVRKDEDLQEVLEFIRGLNEEHPKAWEAVLLNNLTYHRKFGKSIYSLHTSQNYPSDVLT